MSVSGSVFDSSPMVHVFINELLIASVPTAPDKRRFRWARTFSFKISTASLSLFPPNDQARLAISTGRDMLRDAAGGVVYRCDWPEGEGGIEAAILGGAMLTAHRRNRPAARPCDHARNGSPPTTGWRRSCARNRASRVFLYYGSLLGAVRDNARHSARRRFRRRVFLRQDVGPARSRTR
jgi:hypothetical protein